MTPAAVQPDPPPSVCVNGNCAVAAASNSGVTIKWNPGIYLWNGNPYSPTQQAADFALLSTLSTNASIAGIKLVVDWKYLEGSTPGDYSGGFAIVDAYLAQLATMATPKRLILELYTSRYGNCNGTLPAASQVYLPAYFTSIDTGTTSQVDLCTGGMSNSSSIYNAAIWNPVVMNRLIALSAAYAARYNSNPLFEMFQPFEQTSQFYGNSPSVGIGNGSTDSGYTFAGANAQILAFYKAAASQWTNTLVRFPINDWNQFTDSSTSAMLNSVIGAYNANARGLIAGGPDTVPESAFPIMANFVFRGNNSTFNGGNGQPNAAYTNYQVKPLVPWVAEIQSSEMCQTNPFYCNGSSTLANEGAYGYGTMKASFWIVYMGSWLPAGNQPADVLSNVAAGSFPFQSAYPSNW